MTQHRTDLGLHSFVYVVKVVFFVLAVFPFDFA